jgi:hypothetical protein
MEIATYDPSNPRYSDRMAGSFDRPLKPFEAAKSIARTLQASKFVMGRQKREASLENWADTVARWHRDARRRKSSFDEEYIQWLMNLIRVPSPTMHDLLTQLASLCDVFRLPE